VRGQSDAPRPNGSSSQQLKSGSAKLGSLESAAGISGNGWVQRELRCLGSRGGRRGKNGKKLSKNMVKARALVERRPYT